MLSTRTSRHQFPVFFCAVLALAALASPPAGAAGSEAARELIDELGLSASATPVSQHPGWEPRRVVVTLSPRLGGDTQSYREALRAAAGDVELVFADSFVPEDSALAGADAIIGFCTPRLLERADPRLRWLHSYSVGMDRCTGLSDAQRELVLFTNNQRLSAPAIAEHALAMLLSLTRNLPDYLRAQDRKQWQRQLASGVSFGELEDKTLLVAGLGGIGTEIARRAHGLGMRVIATRNTSREGPGFVDYVGLAPELHKLAGEADVVVNALPLTDKTRGLFDGDFFDALKPGAIFLSVGRGESTVTADLVDALQSGRLYGAGLDVTDPEPLPPESPLWNMDNVIITPHVAAAGSGSSQRSMIIAVENLRRYVAGEPMLNVVDIERGY